MPRLPIVLLLCLLSTFSAQAQQPRLVFVIEDFLWQEYDVYGDRILAESGLRYAFVYLPATNTAIRYTQNRFYFGEVFYDGHLMDGSPYTATTGYYGFGSEQTWLSASNGSGAEFVLGLDIWSRILDKNGSLGYAETYTVLYSRAGLRHQGNDWSSRVGIKLPLLVREVVEQSLFLAPSPEPSLYAEIAYQRNRFHIGLYADGYRFAASPPSGGYYQPTSTMNTIGIRFSVSND